MARFEAEARGVPLEDVQQHLGEIRRHLSEELIPFWMTHGVDDQYGGFLTYFDRNGNATGETMKSLLCQARMIYAFSLAHKAGYGDGYFLDKARDGARFVIEHYWDAGHKGWFWTAERDGKPLDRKKIIYGHSFVIYAFSELAKAGGDPKALQWARKTFDILQTHAADNRYGGYYEFFEENWEHTRPGEYGGDRKGLDVHMHLMEAFTNLYDATKDLIHKRRAEEIISLILDRMVDPESGTGIAQFSPDFTQQRAIIFKNVWGSDRGAQGQEGRPLDNTSYGHNVELGWLLNHSVDVLALPRDHYLPAVKKLYDHCLEYGVDWDRGGVYCEGPRRGPARERNKEFWQQAETLVGMLDGVSRLGDASYWNAYKNIHRFVFDHLINHEVGEWFALLGPDNEVLWDYLGHAWKINYHTLRSMIQCEQRLARICAELEA